MALGHSGVAARPHKLCPRLLERNAFHKPRLAGIVHMNCVLWPLLAWLLCFVQLSKGGTVLTKGTQSAHADDGRATSQAPCSPVLLAFSFTTAHSSSGHRCYCVLGPKTAGAKWGLRARADATDQAGAPPGLEGVWAASPSLHASAPPGYLHGPLFAGMQQPSQAPAVLAGAAVCMQRFAPPAQHHVDPFGIRGLPDLWPANSTLRVRPRPLPFGPAYNVSDFEVFLNTTYVSLVRLFQPALYHRSVRRQSKRSTGSRCYPAQSRVLGATILTLP